MSTPDNAQQQTSPQLHQVVAVVDKQSEDTTVLWHVQTRPDAPAGVLSGSWILGANEVAPERMGDLLRDTVVLPVGETTLADECQTTTLRQIHDGIKAAVAEVRAYAKAAKENNKNYEAPRFEPVVLPDPGELADSFHGEESARHAWAHATALADLVEQWHAVESQRRSRKYLQEHFGAEIRPLPLTE